MKDSIQAEIDAREMAKGCNVYSSNKDTEHDARIKATRSGMTSKACGDRWMAAMKLKEMECT
jgi:heat shock protein HslJ